MKTVQQITNSLGKKINVPDNPAPAIPNTDVRKANPFVPVTSAVAAEALPSKATAPVPNKGAASPAERAVDIQRK